MRFGPLLIFSGSVDVKLQHGHRGLKRHPFPSLALFGRPFQTTSQFYEGYKPRIVPCLVVEWHDFSVSYYMKEKKATDIIPDQETGRSIDAESDVELRDEERARARFQKAKSRLENVNEWKNYAGDISATFQLIDRVRKDIKRKPEQGDYLKIDIPGPGSKTGGGYDWVQIEEIVNTSEVHVETFGFRVRPTSNPDGDEESTAHFYSEESTSSFIVERKGSRVTASVHDRNTKPNTNAADPLDKIRDTLVGTAGALSFSKIQWKALTDGLVKQ